MKSKLREMMKANSTKIMAAMKQEFQARRFDYGTQNGVRLLKALGLEGLHHLHNRTLLTPEVHALHAERLAKRYLKKLTTVERSVRRQQQDLIKTNQRYGVNVGPLSVSAHDRFRFVTVLDRVEVLNSKRALRIAQEFKTQLQSVIESCQGVWCLGVIEVELVSMEMMWKIKDQSDSEERKLEVLESMVNRLSKRDRELSCYFLIHFHGVVAVNHTRNIHELEKQLKQIWKWEPRQVLVKPLSKVFNGKPKTPRENLTDIARYITKGGNDWNQKKAYLRYKLAFDNEHDQSEDAWINKNWRRNKDLRRERKEEGLEDVLGMTRSEICALAQVIDGMMGWTRNRTGYLVSARGKRKKLTTTGSRTRDRGIAA